MMEAVRLAAHAMGTRFEVIVRDGDAVRARAAGEAALTEVELWHTRLSVFDRASFLSFINAEAHERAVRVDTELFALLALCGEVWRDSGGAFDPTVGGEMVRRGLQDRAGIGPAVDVGFDAVILDERARTVRFTRRGISLDLGGVAKGFALDRAAEVLREAGIADAFIHGGTSSGVALGEDVGGAWRVAMGEAWDAPRVVLRDAAYSVSSPTGRVAEGAHHILDPVRDAVIPLDRTAAVWGGSSGEVGGMTAALCDAWSTALVVLGGRPGGMPMELSSAVGDDGVWGRHDIDADRVVACKEGSGDVGD